MATQEPIDIGDIQRRMLHPGWAQDDYKGERRLLYESLKEGEIIERLYGCGWRSPFYGRTRALREEQPGVYGAVGRSFRRHAVRASFSGFPAASNR